MSLTMTPSPFLATEEQSVGLFPMPSELTVAQAAKFLRSSEGYVNEMLNAGHIEFRLENGECLIQRNSLLEFEQERESQYTALENIVRWSEEMGLYDD